MTVEQIATKIEIELFRKHLPGTKKKWKKKTISKAVSV
jgi:hypothetical protein